jgi:hypothetical protein
MKNLFVTLFVILISISISFACDTLSLMNQQCFIGKVVKIENGEVVFKANGEKYSIPATDIYSIVFENKEDKVYQDYLALDSNQTNLCLLARNDAQMYHGKKGGHFVLGVLFGPFAIIATAAISSPTPYSGSRMHLSKNQSKFKSPEYLKCYKRKAKGQLLVAETIGWVAWMFTYLVLSGGR